jgi:hypothetical protein
VPPGRRSPILVVTEDPALGDNLRKVAGMARTPVSNDVRRYDQPEDICDARALEAAMPCVVAVPRPGDEAADVLGRLQRRLDRPRVIVVLPKDDPAQAWGLLCRGAYDVVWLLSRHLRHLCQAIGHAANGARQPPYEPVFRGTREYDPRPDRGRWAIVYPEEEGSSETNDLDYWVLREQLPRCFGLPAGAVEFQEVSTPCLPESPDVPDLVFALLSEPPRARAELAPFLNKRAAFLAAMKGLEDNRKRVLYLHRSADPLAHPLGRRRPWRRVVPYRSAIELLLRLYFGFGGAPPGPGPLTELYDHDAAQQAGR